MQMLNHWKYPNQCKTTENNWKHFIQSNQSNEQIKVDLMELGSMPLGTIAVHTPHIMHLLIVLIIIMIWKSTENSSFILATVVSTSDALLTWGHRGFGCNIRYTYLVAPRTVPISILAYLEWIEKFKCVRHSDGSVLIGFGHKLVRVHQIKFRPHGYGWAKATTTRARAKCYSGHTCAHTQTQLKLRLLKYSYHRLAINHLIVMWAEMRSSPPPLFYP